MKNVYSELFKAIKEAGVPHDLTSEIVDILAKDITRDINYPTLFNEVLKERLIRVKKGIQSCLITCAS